MIARIRRWWYTRKNMRWFRQTYGCDPAERLAGYTRRCLLCGRPYDECTSVARCYMEQLAKAERAGKADTRGL